MISAHGLLMVTLIVQAGTLLGVVALARSGESRREARANDILRPQLPLSLVFFAICLRWKAEADEWIVLFAALFVLASATHAVLVMRGDAGLAALAIRALVVALVGLGAQLALATLMT